MLLVHVLAYAQLVPDDDYDPLFPVGCGSNTNPNVSGCSHFGTSLYTFLAGEEAQERTEYGAGNFVFSGCLGATAAGLSHTPSACTAYNANIRGTETGGINYPDNSVCWVAMDENRSGANAGLPGFIRVSDKHYLINCSAGSQPTMPADAQLLMKVTTALGSITAVVDLRNLTKPFTAVGGGFSSAGNGLTAAGPTVSLAVPVSVPNGGTGAVVAGPTAAHNIGAVAPGVDINGSDQVTVTHLAAPLPVAQGGT